jgi:hypothetical protein
MNLRDRALLIKIPIINLCRIKIITEQLVWNSRRSGLNFGKETGYAELCFAKLKNLYEITLLRLCSKWLQKPSHKIWELITIQHSFVYQRILIIMKQDRQYKYNETLRLFRETIVEVEKQ